MGTDEQRIAATKPYCEGGTGTCEVCVGSCGIEEYEAANAAYSHELEDPLAGANCSLCGATADNFHVPDDLWERVGLGHVQACFKCFRIAAWHAGVKNDGNPWEVCLASAESADAVRRAAEKLVRAWDLLGGAKGGNKNQALKRRNESVEELRDALG